MDLKIILRTFYLAFLLYLCDRIGAQNVSKSSSLEIDNDISNDQKLKYEVEVLSSVAVDLVASPKKLGEIEFDIEVHEELPQKDQSSPPEIAIIPENGSNKSNSESGVKVEVMTDIAVDLVASPKKIGDIEFDIEVEGVVPKKEESRAPEIVVIPKKGDTVLPHYSFGDNGLDFNQTIGDFQFNNMTDFKIKNFGADLDLSDLEKSDSKSSSDDIHLRQAQLDLNKSQSQNASQTQSQSISTGFTRATGSSGTDTTATTNETEPEPEISTITPKSKESSTTIWPVILVAIIFIVLVVIGLIWALKTFFKVKNLEDEEKKQFVATPDGGLVSARSGSASDSSAMTKNGSVADSLVAAKSGSVTDASAAAKKSSSSGSSPAAVSQDKKDFSKELSVRSN